MRSQTAITIITVVTIVAIVCVVGASMNSIMLKRQLANSRIAIREVSRVIITCSSGDTCTEVRETVSVDELWRAYEACPCERAGEKETAEGVAYKQAVLTGRGTIAGSGYRGRGVR